MSVAWTTCRDCGRVLTLAWVEEHGPVCPECKAARAAKREKAAEPQVEPAPKRSGK